MNQQANQPGVPFPLPRIRHPRIPSPSVSNFPTSSGHTARSGPNSGRKSRKYAPKGPGVQERCSIRTQCRGSSILLRPSHTAQLLSYVAPAISSHIYEPNHEALTPRGSHLGPRPGPLADLNDSPNMWSTIHGVRRTTNLRLIRRSATTGYPWRSQHSSAATPAFRRAQFQRADGAAVRHLRWDGVASPALFAGMQCCLAMRVRIHHASLCAKNR